MAEQASEQKIDYTAMDSVALLNALGDDAYMWADAFRQHVAKYGPKINGGIIQLDHGWMITWFASAIEHSYDVRRWRAEKAAKGDTRCIVPSIVQPQ